MHLLRTIGACTIAGLFVACAGPQNPITNPLPAPVTNGTNVARLAAASTSTIQRHVFTADYLGAPYGTTSVSAAEAAPYLTWASIGVQNANTYSAAGIRNELYVSPDRLQSTDPMYSMSPATAFGVSCSGYRVTTTYTGLLQYIMTPGSSALQSTYRSYVAQATAGYHVDALYEDNAINLSHYVNGTFAPTLPCGYSDAAWISGEKALDASVGKDTILNGLNGLDNEGPSELVQVVEQNPSTIGGNFESCFTSSDQPMQPVWVWTATEQTQIDLVANDKHFQCMGGDQNSAETQIPERIYELASFEMTYNPALSILWDRFATPSGFHVLPESGFVALNPLVTEPEHISELETPQKVYLREYRTCYYNGSLVGACAMVVNNDYYAHPSPSFHQTYHHTLTMSGYGVLEHGNIFFDGSAPPATMAALSAYVALP